MLLADCRVSNRRMASATSEAFADVLVARAASAALAFIMTRTPKTRKMASPIWP